MMPLHCCGPCRLSLLLLSLAALPALAATPAAPVVPVATPVPVAPAVADPWFGRIPDAFALSEPLANRLCTEIARSLDGATPDLAFLPADTKPRVVLVTCRTAKANWPVTLAGAGFGLGTAVADAVRQLTSLPNPVPAAGLKLDLVQHAIVVPDFELRKSMIPQPSLVGMAFSKTSGFVFPPEAILAQGLVTPKKLLNLQRIEEDLLANRDLGRFGVWQQIAAYQGPQGLFLFESQSHYADRQTVSLLFRGHRVVGTLNRRQIEQSGRNLAEFLVRHSDAGGTFQCTYPRWQSDEAGGESPADLAQVLVALLEWQQVQPEKGKDIPGTVEKGLASLLKNLQPFKPDTQAACIVEDYRSRLCTNALTAAALAKHGKLTPNGTRRQALLQLGRYLVLQMQPDGSFVAERYFPSGNVRAVPSDTAAAQAALALVRIYEATGDARFLDAAKAGLRFLFTTAQTAKEGIRVPHDGWLLMALNEAYTYWRDKSLLPVAERMIIATLASQTTDPLFPDFLGCWENLPITGETAARTHGLFTAAQLFGDTHRELLAGKAREAGHLGLIFTLQAQLDSAAVLHAPSPGEVTGAFRSHLLSYDAGLSTQAQALLALATALRAVPGDPEQFLPISEAMRVALQAAHNQVLTFPRCLPRKVELPEETPNPVIPTKKR